MCPAPTKVVPIVKLVFVENEGDKNILGDPYPIENSNFFISLYMEYNKKHDDYFYFDSENLYTNKIIIKFAISYYTF
tara:strand:+ start:99 stop:329 length:231 start_codon:yes stop_codon:yes gene_type:complete